MIKMKKLKKIAVIGLDYVGLPLAVHSGKMRQKLHSISTQKELQS